MMIIGKTKMIMVCAIARKVWETKATLTALILMNMKMQTMAIVRIISPR